MPGSAALEEAAGRLALAEAGRAAGDWAACEAQARAAVELAPLAAGTQAYLGRLLAYLGRPEEGLGHLRQAYSFAPEDAEIRHSLCLVLLQIGRWLEAYEHFEAREALPAFAGALPDLPFPRWRGEPLAGKRLLIWVDPSLANQIQMARFAPYLQARGAQVTLLCQPGLAELAASAFAAQGVEVVAAAGAVQFADPDYWTLPASIPALLALTPASLPTAPYLHATPASKGERIGLWWRGEAGGGLAARPDLPGLDLGEIGDLPALAQAIAGLELVATVDGPVAHLAGAMGKPVWILLPRHGADVRWGAGRDDSPWYPSARLYRQPAAGDWAGVIAQVRGDLAARGLA